jgi:hypothetical protein
MQLRTRLSVVATVGLTMVLAACSSSTAPSAPPTPQALATHFDSIYSSLLAQGTEQDSEIADLVAVYVELSPAYGSQDATFNVTTASGTSKWLGYTFEGATTGAGGDSIFYAVIFSDLNLSNVVVTEMEYNSSGVQSGASALAIAGLANGGSSTSFSGSVGVASTGAACAVESGLAAGPVIAEFVGTDAATCTFATFGVSFQASFSPSDNLGALTSVTVSNATFNGLRFMLPAGPSHVAPIPSRLAAAALRLRALTSAHKAR